MPEQRDALAISPGDEYARQTNHGDGARGDAPHGDGLRSAALAYAGDMLRPEAEPDDATHHSLDSRDARDNLHLPRCL
jgi:hypothetical protein